jgi:NAD+ diphosphatase
MKHSIGFIVQGEGILLLKNNNKLPVDTDLESIAPHFLRRFELGSFNEISYFCAELDPKALIPEPFHIISLRSTLSLLNCDYYRIAVKAYSVIRWDKNHQFCSCCGSRTVHKAQGFERSCTLCHLSFFPRISPSIIVLIKKEEHLLMARSPDFLPGVYGLIAGFVDAGESIEEAVYREVKEEVGIKIKNLNYFGSQQWPFPDSLMIAFTADYCSGDITINPDEIEEAGWYKYDNLPGRPQSSISIASKLIEDFVKLY